MSVINDTELGLDDYPIIIKKPMDLSSVEVNLIRETFKKESI